MPTPAAPPSPVNLPARMRTSAHQHRDEDALWGSTLAGSRDGQAECDWHAGLTPGPGVRGRLDSTFPLRRISDRSETGDW